VYGQTALNKQ